MSSDKPHIRWGRGFFRAWVVVSIIWVFSSVSIFHSEIKYKIPEFPLHIGGDYIKFGADEEFYKKTNDQKQKIIDQIISDIPDQQKDSDITKIWPTEKDRKNWHLDKKTILWSGVFFVIELAIAPPIIILILGVMTGWAISGFKRT